MITHSGTLPHTSGEPWFAHERLLNQCAILVVHLQSAKGMGELLGQALVESVLHLGFQRIESGLRHCDRASTAATGEYEIYLDNPGSAEDVIKAGQRLVELTQRAYVVRGQMLFLHASIGAALCPAQGATHSELLEQASIALKYAALEAPGTVVLFQSDMQLRLQERQALTVELRKALPLRQLAVYYQPQVELPSCRLTGFEALIRWNHPVRGWIPPNDFIPLAEEIGLIGNIGSWVLRTACRDAMLLPGSLTMAVNASPLQLKTSSLFQAVTEALDLTGLPSSRLEVEITEGVLLERSGNVQSTLHQLHGLGVRLAIDDFGTGYSSLGQLAHLPFDTIKIDRSLVGTGAKNRAIIQAISTLGVGLGMTTLIEGIESPEQLAGATHDGCSFAQGYLFGRAVPVTELDGVLSRFNLCH